MSRTPSGTDIKTGLSADEIKFLAEWFRESYAQGWRPSIQDLAAIERNHAKLAAIYGETMDQEIDL